jgi:predicted RNA binding protein with dsRBD fold (UPF0201 family)
LKDEKLDKASLKRIESLLEEIRDEEIRKSMREVLIKGAMMERSRKRSP